MIWVIRMAGRELWAERARLLLLSLCLALGVFAYSSVSSFTNAVRNMMKTESRSILGGDFSLTSAREFPELLVNEIKALPWFGKQLLLFDTVSMGQLMIPGEKPTRLLDIRVLTNTEYPLVGKLVSDPPDALAKLPQGVLIDQNLAHMWNVKSETLQQNPIALKLGNIDFIVQGIVLDDTSRQANAFSLGPRIYLTFENAKKAGLLSEFSRYTARLLLTSGSDSLSINGKKDIQALTKRYLAGARVQAAQESSGSLARPLKNLSLYLDLVSLSTLLLATLGAFASMHTYLQDKIPEVAVLRTLGMKQSKVSLVFACSLSAVALLGMIAGMLPSTLAVSYLTDVFRNFLPAAFPKDIPPLLGLLELTVVFFMVLLLSLPSLFQLGHVPPSAILRSEFKTKKGFKLGSALCYFASLCLFCLLVYRHSQSLVTSMSISGGLLAVVVLLALLSQLMLGLFKKAHEKLSMPARTALYRLANPGSLSGLVIGVMGIAAFLACATRFVQNDIVAPIAQAESLEGRPNVFLADVQTTQLEGVQTILQDFGGTEGIAAPLVRARISRIDNEDVVDAPPSQGEPVRSTTLGEENTSDDTKERMRTREQNLTYRAGLAPGEEIVAGKFWAVNESDPAQVSLEQKFAENIGVKIGSSLVFDIQGVPITAKVTSFRKVTWQNLRPNFFIVAHPSLLADAPQIHVVASNVTGREKRIVLQKQMVDRYPNITVVDVSEVAERIWNALDGITRISSILSAMMLFSSLAVLAGSVIASRPMRVREFAILRTLGATNADLMKSLFVEFTALGILGALPATFLAYVAAVYYTQQVLELPVVSRIDSGLPFFAITTLFSLIIGLLCSLKPFREKPLAVLRSE
jgi:putative ABC transport system permease protein